MRAAPTITHKGNQVQKWLIIFLYVKLKCAWSRQWAFPLFCLVTLYFITDLSLIMRLILRMAKNWASITTYFCTLIQQGAQFTLKLSTLKVHFVCMICLLLFCAFLLPYRFISNCFKYIFFIPISLSSILISKIGSRLTLFTHIILLIITTALCHAL